MKIFFFFFFLASYGEENQIIMISVVLHRKKVLWVKCINIKLCIKALRGSLLG
jgi:hypothetical protein